VLKRIGKKSDGKRRKKSGRKCGKEARENEEKRESGKAETEKC
jgi:hypothetical protein